MPLNPISLRAYNYITNLVQDGYANTNHTYVSPQDTEEDKTSQQTYTTMVVCGTPLRPTKSIFVTEMNDFYSDAELNTLYHSADEYRNAIVKYGYIYKSQKFENADTPAKLFDYAKDWVKNNYHGGITSFSVSALDMHNAGIDTEKYLVGQRVPVIYIDPFIHQEVQQTLTIISCDYNLESPDKNNYKIGIPDVAMNKVYGETKKKSGGGGGGGKTADETDNEVDLDGVNDTVDEATRQFDEILWNMIYKTQKNGDSGFDLGTSETPGQRSPFSNFTYNLTADGVTSTQVKTNTLHATRQMTAKYIKSEGGLDADVLGVNKGNITDLTSDAIKNTGLTETGLLEVLETIQAGGSISGDSLSALTDVLAGGNVGAVGDVTAGGDVNGQRGVFRTFQLAGHTIGFRITSGNPVLIFDGTSYTLALAE